MIYRCLFRKRNRGLGRAAAADRERGMCMGGMYDNPLVDLSDDEDDLTEYTLSEATPTSPSVSSVDNETLIKMPLKTTKSE